MSKSYYATVNVKPSRSNTFRSGRVKLATTDKASHVNVILEDGVKFNSMAISPVEARQLRDHLNAMFPVERISGTMPTLMFADEFLRMIEPVNHDAGRFIVCLLENGVYKPSAKPVVHTSEKLAKAEAERLAKVHGGTFHVLEAIFEADRPKVVVPPVKTRTL